jgi:hypothetical protein
MTTKSLIKRGLINKHLVTTECSWNAQRNFRRQEFGILSPAPQSETLKIAHRRTFKLYLYWWHIHNSLFWLMLEFSKGWFFTSNFSQFVHNPLFWNMRGLFITISLFCLQWSFFRSLVRGILRRYGCIHALEMRGAKLKLKADLWKRYKQLAFSC